MTRAREWLLIAVLTAVQFTNMTDFVVMMPLGPRLQHTFHITPAQLGMLISSYNLAAGCSALAAVLLLDRFDRKTALLGCYGGFIVGTAACAVAGSWHALMAARIVAGAFGGVLGAVALAIVGDAIPFARRGAAMGALMTSFSLASVLGVPIGMEAAGLRDDWRAPFAMVAVTAVVVWALAALALPAMRGHMARRAADAGAQLGAVLGEPNHWRALLLSVTLILAGFTVIPYMSTYLVTNVGLEERHLKYVYLCGGVVTVVSAPLIGRLADRFGKIRTFTIIALCSLVPIALVTHLPPLPVAAALACTTLFVALVSGRFIPASALISGSVRPELRGGFMSLNAAVQAATMGAASLIGGMIIVQDAPGAPLRRYGAVGWLAMTCTVIAVAAASRVRVRDGGHDPGEAPVEPG